MAFIQLIEVVTETPGHPSEQPPCVRHLDERRVDDH